LFLVRAQNIRGLSLADFTGQIPMQMQRIIEDSDTFFHYYFMGDESDFRVGLAVANNGADIGQPNVDFGMGKFHADCQETGLGTFDFGIGRTKCNYVSTVDEIYEELDITSLQNLKDNLTRWGWTYFNRANDYFASIEADAVIQPILHYDHHLETYSLKGGEVFVGGKTYESYHTLINDVPADQDLNRIELLILEKLAEACAGAPGLLKFNVSPQTLIDTFDSDDKVFRFIQLLKENKINPLNVRLELIEKPYEDGVTSLKSVCQRFWKHGVSFAADDFGVKSQSHQVVLDLGEMIKEFKLVPISFKFKPDEDHTKFLDNLAFIDYCKRLADNREAIITAEAVDDYDTLCFLIAHQVFYFQTNLFCRKMSIRQYSEAFHDMQNLPESVVRNILTSENLLKKQKRGGNIFKLAKKIGAT